MAKPPIAATLRELRHEASRLNATLHWDLEPFHVRDGVFRRLPTSDPPKPSDVNASTSCTALMALCSNMEFDRFFNIRAKPEELQFKRREQALVSLNKIINAEWTSSGLDLDNPFTTTLILRTAGFLAHGYKLHEVSGLQKKWRGSKCSLRTIATKLAQGAPGTFELDKSLRPNPAIGYWLVEGIHKLQIKLNVKAWEGLSKWATDEFTRQLSLVTAHDDAIMDPVAMAMAACLAERLRAIASEPAFRYSERVKRALPTRLELDRGIELLFDCQERSGIWDKFFPMFYYRDANKPGGANYCFAFEFLEALLNEFGATILRNEKIVSGLGRALTWCSRKRLQYSDRYRGWNSAQQLDSVEVGKPESWATAVVHMYLRRLREVLSDEIQRHILKAYNAKYLQVRDGTESLWDRFVTPKVEFADGKVEALKEVIDGEIIARVPTLPESSKHLLVQDRPRLLDRLEYRRSALLFGPPGTSKTTLVEAVAEKLEWPFVEITPSHFLREGLSQIYEEANRIFDDLMDLSGVVILFDEMDALVQRRGAAEGRAQLDVTRQFLTTSMLPKLAHV